MTLEQAIAETIARHPLLAAADGRISTAQGLLEQAALRPNPRLAFQVENLRGPWQGSFNYARDTDNFVWLSQTIETAKKRQYRSELAGVNRQVAESARLLLQQQLVARVKQAWWNAVGTERARVIYEETQKTFAQIVDYHVIRVREGSARPRLKSGLQNKPLPNFLLRRRSTACPQLVHNGRRFSG